MLIFKISSGIFTPPPSFSQCWTEKVLPWLLFWSVYRQFRVVLIIICSRLLLLVVLYCKGHHWKYVEEGTSSIQSLTFVLILTISTHCFGYIMRIAKCQCVFLRPAYFSNAFFTDFQCVIMLLRTLSVALNSCQLFRRNIKNETTFINFSAAEFSVFIKVVLVIPIKWLVVTGKAKTCN